MSLFSTDELGFGLNCSASTASVALMLLYPNFFYLMFDLHEIQCNSSFVSLSQDFFFHLSMMVNVFSLFVNSDISCTFCFCFVSLC